ncbi:PKD domain-containing protein [Halorubrum sp. DTA46]|uniref:PKD domain-containing protein n=1 Tax=Halorubrum sp. DTA46 TaxID=3402162 RepID=UPI003AABD5BE
MKLIAKQNQRKTLSLVLTLVVILSVLGSVGTVAAQEVTTLEQSETDVTAAPGETVELTTTFSVEGLNAHGMQVAFPSGWDGTITDADGGAIGPDGIVWLNQDQSATYEVTYQIDVPEDAEEGDYTVDVEGSGFDPGTGDRIVESTQTTITVEEPDQNTPPTADAGDDQTVDEGDSVTLDATGSSDQDGDALTYQWTQTAGPDVTLSDADTATPSFTAPEVDGDETLTFQVEVSDGQASDTDTVDITVQDVPEPNQEPTAAFTVDPASPEVGEDVTLDASNSEDSDGDIVSYEWSIDGQTLDDTGETVTTSFDTTGDYDVALTVEDDDGATDTTSQVVTVVEAPPENQDPIADAGDDQTVDEGTEVTLDASGSSDPDGDNLSYLWSETTSSGVTLDSDTSVMPSFTAPSVESETTLTFEVEVSDGNGGTDTDEVNVTVQPVTEAPAPADFQVSNLNAPDSATQGEAIDVSADVTNDGDEEATQTVEFRLDLDGDGTLDEGEILDSQEVTLDGDETQTVTFSDIDTGGLLAGDYAHGVFTDDDSATATITIDESEASASETSVSLSPQSAEVVAGNTETYDVVVDSADGGVGAYELTVSLDDASVASITDVTIAGNPGLTNVNYAEDNSSVTIRAALMDTDDTGSVSIASITVEGTAEGSSDISLDVQALGNEDGESYTVTDENGASISVVELPPIGNFQNSPTDPDGDGLYEDINGDGEFNIVDVQALFANLDDETIQNNPDKFDFNQDGVVDVVDVQKLFTEVP